MVSQILSPGSSGEDDLTGLFIPAPGTISSAQQEGMRMQYVQKQQRWLLFLRHCAKCTQNEESCQYKRNCRIGKELWHHILICTDPQCKFARCIGSRDLLKHHHKCQSNNCPICTPVKAYVRRGRQRHASGTLPAPSGASAAGGPPPRGSPQHQLQDPQQLMVREADPQLEGGEGSEEEREEEDGPAVKRARILSLEGLAPPASPAPHPPQPLSADAQQLANLPADLGADMGADLVAGLDADMASAERQERQVQLQRTLSLLAHSCSCEAVNGCGSASCRKVRGLFQHAVACQSGVAGGCQPCRRMWGLLNLHAKHCTQEDCAVPRCKALKDLHRQDLAARQAASQDGQLVGA